ncbi:MFS transporter [Sporomusa termitida]|uniref:4-hydroxybenzoate transporter PcaK n=1 Tax=Sporomusa termitida TaxID=2377 RepID=A0A517DV04_9FIRM|nr:MFS transporter [Sporomusa termitida]QDR81189.1 4-hydroxybenzoate transporter PcaK [Sporomusa termitida]
MRTVAVNEIIDQGKFNKFYKNVLFVSMLTAIFDGFDLNVFSLVVPQLMADWNLTPAQVGLLGSYGFVGMIAGSFLAGPLSEKIGSKRAMMLATATYCIFTTAVGFADNFNEFALCRVIAGLGLASAYPLAIAHVSEYSPKAIRSRLCVWVTSGQGAGTLIATLTGLALLSTYGWRVMFYVAAIPVFLVILQHYLPESMGYLLRKGRKEEVARVLSQAEPGFTPRPDDEYQLSGFNAGKSDVTALFRDGLARNTIFLWIGNIFLYIFTFGVLVWLPKLMTLQGWSLNFSLWFTLTWNAGFILGIPLWGWSQDKFGGKKTFLIIAACLLVLVSSLGQLSNAAVLSVVLFLTGACQHGIMGVAASYFAQNYPISCRATGVTWAFGVGRLGGIIGPLVVGALLTYNVPVPLDFVLFSIIPLISASLFYFTTDHAWQGNAANTALSQSK